MQTLKRFILLVYCVSDCYAHLLALTVRLTSLGLHRLVLGYIAMKFCKSGPPYQYLAMASSILNAMKNGAL